jgi:rhodanese-related sulfurtransferase
MSRRTAALLAALCLVSTLPAVAHAGDDCCPKEGEAAAAEPAVSTPDEVKAALADKKVTPVDANGPETREAFGTLPGALLLGEAGVTAELLGEDKSRALVFYCSSEKCGAAPRAAKEAMELGYTEVRVMKAGIKGWAAAGFEVSK